MSQKDYARAIVNLIGFKGDFDLCLDRSNWKFGKKNINYLVLSWRISKKISIPLMFVELDKAGNSNTQERVDLLKNFDEVFGFLRIKSLMADREFIGKKWFQMLDKSKIPYFIRVKENTLLPWGKTPIKAERFFHHLREGESRLIVKEVYGGLRLFCGHSIQGWKPGHCDDQSRFKSQENSGSISQKVEHRRTFPKIKNLRVSLGKYAHDPFTPAYVLAHYSEPWNVDRLPHGDRG